MGFFHKTIKDVIKLIEEGKYSEALLIVNTHRRNDVSVLSPLKDLGNTIGLYYHMLQELEGLLRAKSDPESIKNKALAAEELILNIKSRIQELVRDEKIKID